MPNKEHVEIAEEGTRAWNHWRAQNRRVRPRLGGASLRRAQLSEANLRNSDLRRADLRDADLRGADLRGSDLRGANLRRADLGATSLLRRTDLRRSDLREADFFEADLAAANMNNLDARRANLNCVALDEATLVGANLEGAELQGASFVMSDLRKANLHRVDLSSSSFFESNLGGADLSGATLTDLVFADVDLRRANLSDCWVHGISAWDVNLSGAQQRNLNIARSEFEPAITVDYLEMAQFMYLLINNARIRNVIDSIAAKVVLILGRFSRPRRYVLKALRQALRDRGYIPVLFDFMKPASRDTTETISTIAHMARFVIADITDARSVPQELGRIIPHLPSVPVQPILHSSSPQYAMFEGLKRYPWVLQTQRYKTARGLLASLTSKVIAPAEKKRRELLSSRARRGG